VSERDRQSEEYDELDGKLDSAHRKRAVVAALIKRGWITWQLT
jgi:hypothetical protein